MGTRAKIRRVTALVLSAALFSACAAQPGATITEQPDTPQPSVTSYTQRLVSDGVTEFYVIDNAHGPRLTLAAHSPVSIVTDTDGDVVLAFRDMNGNGELDFFEDWRHDGVARAQYLAQLLTTDQLMGLGLFSPHQRNPEDGLTEDQMRFFENDDVRLVLNAGPADVIETVQWVNAAQAFAENLSSMSEPLIPITFSTDPRSTAGAAFYNADGGNSRWPSNLGLAATFDVSYMESFARTVTREYRALGITNALSPMVEQATEPRWVRLEGTLGEDLEWAKQLAGAYILGYQGSYGQNVWGTESVNTVIKHFAGDGANEGGRSSHGYPGMYEVYHGGRDSFMDRLEIFAAGLRGHGAGATTGLMTAYAVAVDGQGEPLFDQRGVAFDFQRMNILRNEWNWDGVVVTDWGVSRAEDDPRPGRAWYMQGMSEAEIMFEGFLAGVDMFGGNRDVEPVREAFAMWEAKYQAGELPISADARLRESGARTLAWKFNVGLFESPYLVFEESLDIVGAPEKFEAGFAAQLAAVAMVKNDGAIAPGTREEWAKKTVFVPSTYSRVQPNHMWDNDEFWLDHDFENRPIAISGNQTIADAVIPSLTIEILERYFYRVVVEEFTIGEDGFPIFAEPDLSEVDIVLVGMHSPNNGNQHSWMGYCRRSALLTGGEHWYPLSLQWRPYTADSDYVRRISVSGRPLAEGGRQNRSYFGNTSRILNEADLNALERAVAAVNSSGRDIPVVTMLQALNPTVPLEIYEISDAILVGFGVSHQALLHVALGLREPSGGLPVTFPASMEAVERQLEDIADTEPFIGSAGNAWSFGFGLNWSGVIAR
jgi:beta-glucosidase